MHINPGALVSHFELLVKPIAPKTNSPLLQGLEAVSRRVLQGYFLNITNLNDPTSAAGALTIVLRFVIPEYNNAPPGSPICDPESARVLVPSKDFQCANNFFIWDITGGPQSSSCQTQVGQLSEPFATGGTGRRVFQTPGLFTLLPNQTGQFTLLPNTANANLFFNANLEIRGTVEIYSAGPIIVGSRVFVTPEQRGTFLPDNYPALGNASLDFDQLNTILPTATPGGIYSIGTVPATP